MKNKTILLLIFCAFLNRSSLTKDKKKFSIMFIIGPDIFAGEDPLVNRMITPNIPYGPIVNPNAGGAGTALYTNTTSPTFGVNYNSGKNILGAGFLFYNGNMGAPSYYIIISTAGYILGIPNQQINFILVNSNIILGNQAGSIIQNTKYLSPLLAIGNVAIGQACLENLLALPNNSFNSAFGTGAMKRTQGAGNTAIGLGALSGINSEQELMNQQASITYSDYISGNYNVAIGAWSMARATGKAIYNKNNVNNFIGFCAGYGLKEGMGNVGIGALCLTSSFTNGMAISQATAPNINLLRNNQASFNCSFITAIGHAALQRLKPDPFTGQFIIAIGVQAGCNVGANTKNAIFIGCPGPNDAQSGTYIAGIYGHILDADISRGIPHAVFVNSVNELGVLNTRSDDKNIHVIEIQTGPVVDPIDQSFLYELSQEVIDMPIMAYTYTSDQAKNAIRTGIPVDQMINQNNILQLASSIIYDIESGNAYAYDMVSLIPVLIFLIKLLNQDIGQLSDANTTLQNQVDTLQQAFNNYVTAHP